MSSDGPCWRPSRPVIWRWSEELREALIARFKAGEAVKTIAHALGRLASCVEVEVRRPLEGLHGRWRRSEAGADG